MKSKLDSTRCLGTARLSRSSRNRNRPLLSLSFLSLSFFLFFPPRFHFIRLVKIDTRGEWGINRDGRGEREEFSFFLSLPEEFEIRNTRRDFVETLN